MDLIASLRHLYMPLASELPLCIEAIDPEWLQVDLEGGLPVVLHAKHGSLTTEC